MERRSIEVEEEEEEKEEEITFPKISPSKLNGTSAVVVVVE